VVEIKKGARITGTARDELTVELVRKYDAGASIRELAEDSGRSYGFVHRVLADADITLRGRGGNTRRKDK
jgi:predicted transcriptional regulator